MWTRTLLSGLQINLRDKNSGLDYKHLKIVIDDSSVFSKASFKYIDEPRVVINDCDMFIVQATGESWGLYYITFYGRNLRIFVIS